jgi:hypothetical protein
MFYNPRSPSVPRQLFRVIFQLDQRSLATRLAIIESAIAFDHGKPHTNDVANLTDLKAGATETDNSSRA